MCECVRVYVGCVCACVCVWCVHGACVIYLNLNCIYCKSGRSGRCSLYHRVKEGWGGGGKGIGMEGRREKEGMWVGL